MTGGSTSDVGKCHTQNISFIWPIDKTQTGIINPGESGPGSNGNEGVLHIHPKNP